MPQKRQSPIFPTIHPVLTQTPPIPVEKAAQIAHAAAFANGGQCCCAGTRTYVQSGIYDQFVQKATEIAKKRSVGNPFDDVEQGPQVIVEFD